MKTRWIILALLLVFMLQACSKEESNGMQITATQVSQDQAVANVPSTTQIQIKGNQFLPVIVNIKEGETVRWTNMDPSPHSVIFGNFKSSLLSQGQSYERKFNENGLYGYSCGVHPSMQGTVRVE